MAIALPLLVQLFEPVQSAVQWLSGANTVSPARGRPAVRTVAATDSFLGHRAAARRPLRVFRVIEGRSGPAAGRMVISGRIDEVCAELDRLAALESRSA
jgi:hypothetical protein